MTKRSGFMGTTGPFSKGVAPHVQHWVVWLGCLAGLGVLPHAHAKPNAENAEFVISKDGAYVIDREGDVIWSRCVEGMRWNGRTCVGTALLLDHNEAMAHAKARQKHDKLPWRLPRVPELKRLVMHWGDERGVDEKLFPNTPVDWFWSSTANIDTAPVNQYNYGNIVQGVSEDSVNRLNFLHAWAVSMKTGEGKSDTVRRTKLPVRLVWSQQE